MAKGMNKRKDVKKPKKEKAKVATITTASTKNTVHINPGKDQS
ncbi:MAG: hypothetical protein ACEQSU_08560 [Microgenomates group bacterium]|jgi:hypothetical protein